MFFLIINLHNLFCFFKETKISDEETNADEMEEVEIVTAISLVDHYKINFKMFWTTNLRWNCTQMRWKKKETWEQSWLRPNQLCDIHFTKSVPESWWYVQNALDGKLFSQHSSSPPHWFRLLWEPKVLEGVRSLALHRRCGIHCLQSWERS